MNDKIQAMALALGGTVTILAIAFGRIEWSWVGFFYVGFAMILGFWKWIELDKISKKIERGKE